MTTPTPATTTGSDMTTTEPVFGGSITRLHPFDGLFLRAEHLDSMQSYARELTRALGRAGGPGVVHGYTVRLKNGALVVDPGLAFDPTGRPLLMDSPATVALPADPAKGPLWLIKLVAGERSFGDEDVYGRLCDNPGGDEVSARPYIAEGLRIRVHPVSVSGIAQAGPGELRSVAASSWFEQERRDGQSLLATSEHDNPASTSLRSERWKSGTDLVEGDGVPIGLLLRSGNGWDVDIWTVRRDRIDPPPRRAWQQRMGMRPWDVFLAQVLQFQALLARRLGGFDHVTRQQISAFLRLAGEKLDEGDVDQAAQLIAQTTQKLEDSEASEGGLLVDAGILELPPAGFLPLDVGVGTSLQDRVSALLGDHVELRFCVCRPDFVAHAVEEAQHLDRIPLIEGIPVPQIDILVPGGEWSTPGEGQRVITTAHTWVAFHRRRDRDCGELGTDRVTVFEVFTTSDSRDAVAEQIIGGSPVDIGRFGTLEFPAGGSTVSASDIPSTVKDFFVNSFPLVVVALSPTGADLTLAQRRGENFLAAVGVDEVDLRVAETSTPGRAAIYVAFFRFEDSDDNSRIKASAEEPTPTKQVPRSRASRSRTRAEASSRGEPPEPTLEPQ